MIIGIDGTIFSNYRTGIANYAYELLQYLPKYLKNATFVIFSTKKKPKNFLLPSDQFRWVKSSPFYSRSITAYKIFGMAMAAKKENINVFWATGGTAPFFMKCPVILTIYDFVYRLEAESMPLPRRIFRTINQPYWIKHASKIIAISTAVANETEKFYHRKVNAVIQPAADKQFYNRDKNEIDYVKEKYGIDQQYFLILGTIEPRKNIELFLETYLEIVNTRNEKLPLLVICGSIGWKSGKIQDRISLAVKLGLVRVIGFAEWNDLPALYSGAKTLFMPSRYEGFGMPILEARMCKCPVACTDIPAMREAGGNEVYYHEPTKVGITLAIFNAINNSNAHLYSVDFSKQATWCTGANKMSEIFRSL